MAFVEQIFYYSPVVVSLEKAKKQLRFDDAEAFHLEDDLIQMYVDGAVKKAENYINSEISEKKFRVTGSSFDDVLTFSRQIIRSVDVFSYKDVDGTVHEIGSENYSLQTVDRYENVILFSDGYELPEVKKSIRDAVTLEVTTGYSGAEVPEDMRIAILLLASGYHEHREDTVKEKTTSAENLLYPYKRR